MNGAFDSGAFDAATFQTVISTTAAITLGGLDVRHRMRKYGPVIRDILNDAPNTCTFAIDGEAPAVGQRLRITIADGVVVLFAGRIQTIAQTYEGQPQHVVWQCTAIDDTGYANALRPFGTWVSTSATTIATAITPAGFSTSGIVAGLAAVTITFDGSATFIACLTQLATAIGGYCKVEDGIVYLFLEDPSTETLVDADHPCLHDPPITLTTDSSQLRTRVYGKGYGEAIRADLAASETLIPIEDGAMFPALGGSLITGRTADGAQSDRITFTAVQARGLGTLVGPGAAPGGSPTLALQAGAGVTSGAHDVSVVYVTASGKSLAGPAGTVTVGTVAAPTTAATAGTATTGTGPDAGSHDYVVTFSAVGGETTQSPVSNAITTSAAFGQVAAPAASFPTTSPLVDGNLDPAQTYTYSVTFVNATGETEGGSSSTVSPPAVPAPAPAPSPSPAMGGSMSPTAGFYYYWLSYLTAGGYETAITTEGFYNNPGGWTAASITLPTSPDGRITKRRLYRSTYWSGGGAAPVAGYLVVEINDNTTTFYTDVASDATIAANPIYYEPGAGSPSGPRGTPPGYQVHVTNIPIGPAAVTARKIYRRRSGMAGDHLLTTISNNTTTTYDDNTANNDAAADMPTSNTTGTAVQRIPLTAIPIGPAGTTARKVYRRFNGTGTFKLLTTLANNTATTYTDTTANSALGAVVPSTSTAVGNQIALTAIPVGAAAVTQREIYMSPAGGGTRRRVLTIADNTTTTGTITMSDATLAGQITEPASDTSGLQQPAGQVNAGATSLLVASAATFLSTGGWVELGGGQVARYTGVSGQTLTGIPASGAGSITSTVTYGSQAVPAPMLTGVTGITAAIAKGSPVHLWVQRDDLLAQAEQAARTGGTGLVEYLITDARRGQASLVARCDADLAMFSRPIQTVSYATRVMTTKSGQTVTFAIAEPMLYTTLTIQEVTITEIDYAPGLAPRFSVTASSVRFSLEDTLRQLIVKE